MGKATRPRTRPPVEAGGTSPRRPCPCGSGKRYKACHGLPGADVIVIRPFAGLAAEPELVALREFVPSATAPLPLAGPDGGREVTLATVLPMAAAALVREDGTAWVGLTVPTRSGDLSADLAGAVQWARTAAPGAVLAGAGQEWAGERVRLQDILRPEAALEVSVYRDFSWWLAGAEPGGDAALAVERANAAAAATEPIKGDGLTGAYWTAAGRVAYLRWVRPEPEDQLLAALARLAVREELGLGEGSRFAGSFRAHGLLVPVWDLDPERHPQEWAGAVAAFAERLGAACDDDRPLNEAQRRARDGLRSRQVTVR